MTGEERCKSFDAFQAKIMPTVFGEKLGPVENAEVAFRGREAEVSRSFDSVCH